MVPEGLGNCSFDLPAELCSDKSAKRNLSLTFKKKVIYLKTETVEPGLIRTLACVASVSVWFRRKERGTRVKLTARKVVQVKERGGGGEERFPSFPSPSPLLHFLALVSFLARSKPKIPFLGVSFFAPKPNGNSCYAGYTDTKRTCHSVHIIRVSVSGG